MAASLLHAYFPLCFWAGIGIVLFRFVPEQFPRVLGRGLYWIGVPLEIFALARQAQWSAALGTAPLLTISAVLAGLSLSWLTLQSINQRPKSKLWILGWERFTSSLKTPSLFGSHSERWADRDRQGSFMLAAMLGNTGFVGLAVAPIFVSEPYLSWLILYSVTQNVVGTYGIGVFVASYFGRPAAQSRGWQQIWDVLTVPSLWAFVAGSLSQSVALPELIESGLQASVWVIIPAALLLMGMRLSQLKGWQSLQLGIGPSLLKSILVPGVVGLLATGLQIPNDARLGLVLMAGMPTAFAGLILAEEYELDRELIASSIVLTTGLLVVTLPCWLLIFGR
jgi:malate permease and related proteins